MRHRYSARLLVASLMVSLLTFPVYGAGSALELPYELTASSLLDRPAPDLELWLAQFDLSAFTAKRKVLAQYDKDKNGYLDSAERKEALAALGGANSPNRMFMGRGRGNAATITPGPKVSPADIKPAANNVSIYDIATLRTFFLTFEDAEWEKMLMAFHHTDIQVPATLMVDGKSYRDVGVRTRGASSFMMVPEGQKHSLKLTLDFLVKDQNIQGFEKFNLLNGHEDPTLMRAALYYEIARQYLPAYKANYIQLVINGESWGIYTNAQQFNKTFTKEYYGSTKGNRWNATGSPNGKGGLEYLGENPDPYRKIYELDTKESAEAWTGLINLTKVLNQTPTAQLEKALTPILDVDEALRFLALEVALVNNDGFWIRSSDYNIYQDTTGRFHILPHDANESFMIGSGGGGGGRGGRGGPPPSTGRGGRGGGGFGFGMMSGGVTLDPLVGITDTTTKSLRARLLAVPAFREKYLGYVKDIATRWLDWDTFGPMVQRQHDLIAPITRKDTRKLDSTEEFDAGVETLKSFAAQRRAFLLDWKPGN